MRVAVYVRVSTADQTLAGQETDLTAYCRSRGWETVMYRDVQSGADTTRPGLEAMIQAVRRREVGAVVVAKLDRLGRSLIHLALTVEELGRLKVKTKSAGLDS